MSNVKQTASKSGKDYDNGPVVIEMSSMNNQNNLKEPLLEDDNKGSS